MSTMGLFNLFAKKEAIRERKISEINFLKELFPSLDFTEMDDSILIIYNGYPIAKAFQNQFIKQFSWEALVSNFEEAQIREIYKKLEEIYKK